MTTPARSAPIYRWIPARRHAPLPRIEVTAAATFPAAWLRLATLAAVLALEVGAAGRGPFTWRVGLVTGLAAAIWRAAAPSPLAAWAATAVAGACLILSDHTPLDPAVTWLMPLAYLTTRLAAWSALVPWTGRVQAAVLTRTWRRDLAAVALGEALLALAWWTSGQGDVVTAALGAAGLLVVIWLAVVRPTTR
jgi:hypothetical protein